MEKRRIAIACQGGGAHTAFTAGVLETLLEVHGKGRDFEIVALSGTSGGAICAALAWIEILTGEATVDAGARLRRFWEEAYPDGNASCTYFDALYQDYVDFWQTGRLPGLRIFDRLRLEVGLNLLRSNAHPLPLQTMAEPEPSYYYDFFRMLDSATSGLRHLFDIPKQTVDSLQPVLGPWLVNWTQSWLALNPLAPDSLARRELDTQTAFRELLSKHLTAQALDKAKGGLNTGRYPELLIGAVDVLNTRPYKEGAGDAAVHATNFAVFRGSRDVDRLIDAMLASSAIPTLMRGVVMDDTVYWDGLFSQNPPIYDLPDVHSDADGTGIGHGYDPQEIWIVRINPMGRAAEPRSLEEIRDRRNELSGNISLMQEVRSVLRMNSVQRSDGEGTKGRTYEPLTIRFIDMSEEVARRLDSASKLDRRREFINALMRHGREQAAAFLNEHDLAASPAVKAA